jgi:DNA-binding CsgD family transcriptional regulator
MFNAVRDGKVIFAILVVQVTCTVFFVSDISIGLFGLRSAPISWRVREVIEISAAFGLVLGLVLGTYAFLRTVHKKQQAEDQLRLASGAFLELMEERFTDWRLTPSERDVALFAIKGMSTSEIAALRNTSEGTVKAQTNAIYRKADVSGRPQLLSLFIDDLMGEALFVSPK